jgi:hypothetical protein
MLCFIACFVGGNSNTHKCFDESSFRYSSGQTVKIDGKIWIFISYLSNGNCWLYSYEKIAKKFITTFGFFHLNQNEDFIQLRFGDGVDKIETAHDHSPEIIGNTFQVKLRNGKSIDVYLNYLNSVVYDNNCSIAQIT